MSPSSPLPHPPLLHPLATDIDVHCTPLFADASRCFFFRTEEHIFEYLYESGRFGQVSVMLVHHIPRAVASYCRGK